jgi:hypothetical protein
MLKWKIHLLGFTLAVFSAHAWAYDKESKLPAADVNATTRVYVFFQRAASHVAHGKAESFQEVADTVREQLKAGNVAMAENQTGGTYSEGEMPLALVQDMARKAHASFLLYVVVERPHTRWLKVTLHLYEVDGHELWAQEAGVSTFSKSTGSRETIERVRVLMKERVGGPGLPVMPETGKAASALPPAAN